MKKHIVLVDDDKDELFIFVEALSILGVSHKCTWANNGEQALSQLQYLVPDFIFLDINLPGMNGFQLLPKIRQDTKLAQVPVILYSNGVDERTAEKYTALGATICLKKPDSVTLLAKALSSIIEGHTFAPSSNLL